MENKLLIVAVLWLLPNLTHSAPEITTEADKSVSGQRDTTKASDSLGDAQEAAHARNTATFALARSAGRSSSDQCSDPKRCEQTESSVIVMPGAIVNGPLINTTVGRLPKR